MSSDGAFVEAADSIGRRIAADAVWHDGVCSWVGAVDGAERSWRAEYRALEANVYDGTAGVGLFLAQLANATGEAATRRAAIGAMRHAVARAPATVQARREGLHAGSLGIAWAAARAADLLDDEELRSGARRILSVARPVPDPDRCPDVSLGAAGSIIALVALADSLDDPSLLDDAVAAAEQLIDDATVTRHGWSWGIPGHRNRHHLCGLLHGAAGIGWALAELFTVTDDARFRTAAVGAFAYERSWLDAESGTWPDLRIGGQRRGAGRRVQSPAIGTWCHGEGGIALTRLRALDVLGWDVCGPDAEIALETTRRSLAEALPYELGDLSLCHGVAGTADVLLCGATVLGDRCHQASELCADLGRVTLERYAATGDGWPPGAAGGTTPALFRGLAGIGWWLLRLHDDAIPSPLTIPNWPLTAMVARA